MLPREVDLIALEPWEALALRSVLEYLGLRVNLFPVGRATHLLAGLNSSAPHVIVSCHGDGGGIALPEVDRAAVPDDPFYDRLTPTDVVRHVRANGRVVVSTGCGTGQDAFAQAFLQAGAGGFIGPDGDPDDALFFLVHLYYDLRSGRSLDEAVLSAGAHELPGCGMFRLVRPSAG